MDSQNAEFAMFRLINHAICDISDAACFRIIHIMYHPTSSDTTKSTQTTQVNAPKKDFSPLLAGKCGNSIKNSTWRHPHADEGKSCLDAEIVRALGALHSLRSRKRPAAEKIQETHFKSNEDKEQWIEGHVEIEYALEGQSVENTKRAIKQKQEDITNAAKAG